MKATYVRLEFDASSPVSEQLDAFLHAVLSPIELNEARRAVIAQLTAEICGSDVPIAFTCPNCNAGHTRGYVNGIDTFRCLKCGYFGYGHHPDEQIDCEIESDIREACAWEIALARQKAGLPDAD